MAKDKQRLINYGLYSEIKSMFQKKNISIPDKYYVLMTEYIEAVQKLRDFGGTDLDPVELAMMLPDKVRSVVEKPNLPVYGITDEKVIQMNANLDDAKKKLYFFHELTHALQTWKENGVEHCSFSNAENGMFLAEGATQYIAEVLYHVSEGTELPAKTLKGVRGQANHKAYSFLSEYPLNGDILELFAITLQMNMGEILDLGFQKNAREILQEKWDTNVMLSGNNVESFESLMQKLETVYEIDKAGLVAGFHQLAGPPVTLRRPNGTTFTGNLALQDKLLTQVEQELSVAFIEFNDNAYINRYHNDVEQALTTPGLKANMRMAINALNNINPHEIAANK